MTDKRNNKKNVRVSDFTKAVLKKASIEPHQSEVKTVERLVLNAFPEFVLEVKREMVGKK